MDVVNVRTGRVLVDATAEDTDPWVWLTTNPGFREVSDQEAWEILMASGVGMKAHEVCGTFWVDEKQDA